MTDQKDFETAALRAVAHSVAWRNDGPKQPATPSASAQDLRAQFDSILPDQGRDGVEIIDALARGVEGGLMTNTHPNFFAWVQGSSHPVGVAADMLTAAWGQNAGIYQTAPAAAIAEEIAATWLLDLLRLPSDASVVFSTGATMASFICLAAARSEVLHRAGYNLEDEGLIGAPPIHVFLGEEAHATIHSDLRYLGFGNKHLIEIQVDDQGRMMADDLKTKLYATDGPRIIITQAGHINSGAFDPISEICDIAVAHNAWVHVDGAFGLWARATPALASLCEGMEKADSWTTDGHKWLQVPYDSGFGIVKHPDAHCRAMDINASYLVQDEQDGRNPSQYGPELSRRARGFAVWATLQALGRNGVTELIDRHCRCARHLRDRLEPVEGIEVINDVVLNQLAITFDQSDDKTTQVIEALRVENKHFVLGATWKGDAIMRISVISHMTDIEHVDALASSIITAHQL
jgi:glutamate/tyrosine decarboxylase-like PLP-dependent enzyme